MATYNGHKNWNHWNVSLWINNDFGLYEMARDFVSCTNTKDDAAKRMLEHLHYANITHTPDGAPYSKTTIRAAMVEM